MDEIKRKYGSWVLVAGAAEGLGKAYSRTLAAKKLNLIMVDNQEDSLRDLAQELEREYGIETVQLLADLADKSSAKRLMEAIEKHNCRLLIYNAAYSRVKSFLKTDPEELDKYIDVNCRTQIQLIHSFSKFLVSKKNQGGVVLMSSLAGLIGMQLVASYAATKAFTWNLAEALFHELKTDGIDFLACIAGATATPAYLATNPNYGFFKPQVMTPESVAHLALKKLGKQALFIPGFSNRMNYFLLTRILPRKWASSIANKTMGNLYQGLEK